MNELTRISILFLLIIANYIFLTLEVWAWLPDIFLMQTLLFTTFLNRIPNIYFSTRTYEDFITKLKMTEINRISDKSYYKWFWFYFNSKKFQFVSILK